MHLCLENGIDRIPSPYRLFDCSGGRCARGGSSVKSLYPSIGVGDLRDSPQQFGLPCPAYNRSTIDTISEPYMLMGEQEIKASMVLTGKPVIGIIDGDLWRDISTGIYVRIKGLSQHALVIVGWGSTPYHYWVVKNSWGESWGDGVNGQGRIHTSSMFHALDLTGIGLTSYRLELIFVSLFGIVVPVITMVFILVANYREWRGKVQLAPGYHELAQFEGVL